MNKKQSKMSLFSIKTPAGFFIIALLLISRSMPAQGSLNLLISGDVRHEFWDDLDDWNRSSAPLSHSYKMGLSYEFADKWAVQAEFGEYRQHFKAKWIGYPRSFAKSSVRYDMLFNYQTLNLSLRNTTLIRKNMSVYLNYGVLAHYLSKCANTVTTLNGQKFKEIIDLDNDKDIVYRSKLGLLTGIGVKRNISGFSLGAELGMNYIIRNIYSKDELYENIMNFNSRNGLYINLTLGYRLISMRKLRKHEHEITAVQNVFY